MLTKSFVLIRGNMTFFTMALPKLLLRRKRCGLLLQISYPSNVNTIRTYPSRHLTTLFAC